MAAEGSGEGAALENGGPPRSGGGGGGGGGEGTCTCRNCKQQFRRSENYDGACS